VAPHNPRLVGAKPTPRGIHPLGGFCPQSGFSNVFKTTSGIDTPNTVGKRPHLIPTVDPYSCDLSGGLLSIQLDIMGGTTKSRRETGSLMVVGSHLTQGNRMTSLDSTAMGLMTFGTSISGKPPLLAPRILSQYDRRESPGTSYLPGIASPSDFPAILSLLKPEYTWCLRRRSPDLKLNVPKLQVPVSCTSLGR